MGVESRKGLRYRLDQLRSFPSRLLRRESGVNTSLPIDVQLTAERQRERFFTPVATKGPDVARENLRFAYTETAAQAPNREKTPVQQKVEQKAQSVKTILEAHGIHNVTNEQLESQILANVTKVRDYLKPGALERAFSLAHGVEDFLAAILHTGSAGIIDLKRAARNSAIESLNYQAGTGKNPNMGLFGAVVTGVIEDTLSTAEWIPNILGAIPTLGGTVLEGLAVDAIIDFIIGKGIEYVKFPPDDALGEPVQHRTIDDIVKWAGILPVIPVGPTLALSQNRGRGILRKETKGSLDKMSSTGQDILLEAARLETLNYYEKAQNRK